MSWTTGTRDRALRLKDVWAASAPSLGGWCSIPSTFVAEIMGSAGFDWVCLDQQHGLIGDDAAPGMLQGLAAVDTPALVRVAWNDPYTVMRPLDAGAQGVIVPLISNRSEAERAVAATRYPPAGLRSYGPTRTALSWPDYSPAAADAAATRFLMIETLEGLANLDEIAATSGIDGLFVGPADLAVAMGKTPGKGGHEFDEALQLVVDACRRHGVVPGIFCPTLREAREWSAAGFRMLALPSDVRLLREAAMSAASGLRQVPVKMIRRSSQDESDST